MNISQYLKDMQKIAVTVGDYIMRYYGKISDMDKDISTKKEINAYLYASHRSEKSALSRVDEMFK